MQVPSTGTEDGPLPYGSDSLFELIYLFYILVCPPEEMPEAQQESECLFLLLVTC